jgi:hypothetical protein
VKFRKLKAEEIDVRVSTISEKGASLLLYKDARVDMDILDETVTHWQRRHMLIGNNLHCEVSVWCEGIGWVAKSDVGKESNTEKEKGQASDSFKRACVNWGIGRELYTAPYIWVSADKMDIRKNDKTGKAMTHDKFNVEKISYNGNVIDGLAIANQKGVRVFVREPKKK